MLLENIPILSELNILSITTRVLLALILGGLLGIEREQKQRPAGFRTYVIVCLGSTLAALTNIFLFTHFGAGDPARIPAQVISGIGFLGAGTIIVTRNTHIKGLTTAAGLWCTATIGIAVGSGLYTGSIICALVIVFSLKFLTYVDRIFLQNSRYLQLYIELDSTRGIKNIITYVNNNNMSIHNLTIHHSSDSAVITFTLKLINKDYKAQVISDIDSIEQVIYVNEI